MANLLWIGHRDGMNVTVRTFGRRGLSVCVLTVIGIGCASTAAGRNMRAVEHAVPHSSSTCAAGVTTVPKSQVPADVARWAGGAAVVGQGALWTIRSAIDVPPSHQRNGSYLLKFPWYTRPFGLLSISGHRVDGPGTFRSDEAEATDAYGRWVASTFTFSQPGCWEVTGRYHRSSIRFHLRIVAKRR